MLSRYSTTLSAQPLRVTIYVSPCSEATAPGKRTLLEEILDLVRVKVLYGNVLLRLRLSRCSRRRARCFSLLSSPDIPRWRRHSLLPSTILGGGVCARVAVALTLPSPALQLLARCKNARAPCSEHTGFRLGHSFWYIEMVEARRGRVGDIKCWKLSNRSCSARTVSVLQHLNQWGLLCHIIAVTFFRPTHQC